MCNDLRDILIHENNLFIADCGRGEIIILSNIGTCWTPANIANRPVYLILKQGVSSIAILKEFLACLCGDSVEVLKFAVPKSSKPSNLEVKIMKKIKLPSQVNYIFSVPGMNALGLWCASKDIMLCYKVKTGSGQPLFKDLCISSNIKPLGDGCSVIYQPPSSTSISQLSISINNDDELSIVDNNLIQKDVPAHSIVFTKWGCTCFFVVKSDSGHKVMEMGSLSFGLSLAKGLNQFYEAISYIPPHGFQSARKLKLTECIDLASELGNLLLQCETDCKGRFPTLNTFNVHHGSAATDTIHCLQDTIESWKALCSRLDFFDGSLKDVVPFTVTNESVIERFWIHSEEKSVAPANTAGIHPK